MLDCILCSMVLSVLLDETLTISTDLLLLANKKPHDHVKGESRAPSDAVI